MGSFFYLIKLQTMKFNFIPYQFTQSLKDFINDLTYKSTLEKTEMYKLNKYPKDILGYAVKDVFLYFVINNLISSLTTLYIKREYLYELINKLSEEIGTKPIENGFCYKWVSEVSTFYCYYDSKEDVIRLYYTISEYDVL